MKELLRKIWKKEEGFSLIELIIVIAILAIIAAIAVPNLIGNIQDANEGTDESNAKLIYDALNIAVAKEPDFEGITQAAAVAFAPGPVPAVIDHTDFTHLLAVAGEQFPSLTAVPKIKASANGTAGDSFYVLINASGQFEVYNNAATRAKLFPK